MATRNNSANLSPLISRSAANTVFRDAVRLFVGRGKRYTTKQVEIGTGIAARMIESFMAPVDSTDFRKPDFEEVLSLASFLRVGIHVRTDRASTTGSVRFERRRAATGPDRGG
jgi:hypothetical protein